MPSTKNSPKLIIIRGPSGAGKSTVAKTLLKKCKRPTLLVSQDQIRNLFSDQQKPAHQVSKDLTAKAALLGLEKDYDVILEGILGLKMNPWLNEILKAHPEENYFFYLDISYEETVKRHQTRSEKAEFGEELLKEYWTYTAKIGGPAETVIAENSSLEQTIAKIQETAGI